MKENSIAIEEITDEKGRRIRVYCDNGVYQSAAYVDEEYRYELYFEYMKKFNVMFEVNPDIRDVLVIGGAGFSYPEYLISHYPDVRVDVVEIDEKAVELAKQHFYLQQLLDSYHPIESGRLRIIITDGQDYLARAHRRYDAIIVDAFNYLVPALTLMSQESYLDGQDLLGKKGLFLINLAADEDFMKTEYFANTLATLQSVYSHVHVLRAFQNEGPGNYVIMATDRNDDVPDSLPYDLTDQKIYRDSNLNELSQDFFRFIYSI